MAQTLTPRLTKVVDSEARRFQESVRLSFEKLSGVPFLDGTLIEDVTITTGTPKVVNHGLGREPVGFLVLDRDANAIVWQSTTTVNYANRMTLNSSANVTISLWVF